MNKTKNNYCIVTLSRENGLSVADKSFDEVLSAYNRGRVVQFVDSETRMSCIPHYYDGAFRGTIVFARPSIADVTKISRLLVVNVLMSKDTVSYLPMTATFS